MIGNKMTDKFTPPHPLNTAVLFLVFNRLDTTKQVFEAIRRAKPPRLYIAADGAREKKDSEAKKVKAVRDFILNNIDWECEVKTLFRESNVGCGPNVKSSIDWFFEHEDMGIILEDDVCPVQSFFWYCEELLIKYQSDDRIGMISGTNHTDYKPVKDSYIFSKYKGCWGWATWKRAWKNMDFEMDWLNSPSKEIIIKNMGFGKDSVTHWNNAIKSIQNKSVSSWDWQWYFSLASQGQLCIFPKVNLVSNIGFGEDATHTFGDPKEVFIKTKEIPFPLHHPQYILVDLLFDNIFENKRIKNTSLKRFIPKKLKKFIKKLFLKGN